MISGRIGPFSSASSLFTELFRLPSQDLKLSSAHFVELFVFFGTEGFANWACHLIIVNYCEPGLRMMMCELCMPSLATVRHSQRRHLQAAHKAIFEDAAEQLAPPSSRHTN